MGYFYLANCLTLATGPHVLVYRTSGMKDNDAFWKCFKIAMLYVLTQMLKFFLATLIPHSTDFSNKMSFYLELLSIAIDIAFIFMIVRRASSRNEFYVLVGGMGWSTAALVCTKFVPIWVGTRGIEFDVRYLCLSYEANLDMLLTFVLFHSLWLLLRKQGSLGCNALCVLVLVCTSVKHLIFGAVDRSAQSIFNALLVKTIITVSLGTVTVFLRAAMRMDKANSTTGTSAVWKNSIEAFHLFWTQYISTALGLGPNQDNRASVPANSKRHN